MAVNNRWVAANEMERALDKTLKAVIAPALIAASLFSPSFSFAQSSWIAHVERAMRQTLPKEAKCTRRDQMSFCDYETPKFSLGFTGADGGSALLGLGVASARVTFRPPLTQEEQNVGRDMLFAFFKTFNFEPSTMVECVGRGFQRDQWSPEEVKNTDKRFKLKCYGQGTWTLIMSQNNEF